MESDERESLAGTLDALVAALEAERARHLAGLEPEPALGRLFPPRGAAAHPEMLARLRAAGEAGLFARVGALRAEWHAAEHEEAWRAAEAAAAVAGPDGPTGLAAAELALSREPDRGRRLALAGAVALALEGPARHREAAAEVRVRLRAESGLSPDWGAVVEGDQLLAATDDAWLDLVGFTARRDLDLAPAPRGDLTRADLLHLVAFPALDGLFRRPALDAAVRATAADLGLDLERVRVDEPTSAAAWPGARAVGGRVLFRARGGLADWPTLLDALGRALAAAPHPPHRRDATLGPALGGLLAGLCLEPAWLAGRLELPRRQVAEVMRALGLARLLHLRAAAAALRVATEVERGLSGQAWREAHREALSAALHATWDGVRAARDDEAGPLAATLRGFTEGERWRVALRERFDEDWWRNPRTAEHLAGLVAAGRLPEGEPARAVEAGAGLARLLERGG
ncbi:MAG: hypothetical protein IPO09_14590 [Anaeromyxobacter sp.]|nr:hypothetical protein [Anaeromyxobacter sp.]